MDDWYEKTGAAAVPPCEFQKKLTAVIAFQVQAFFADTRSKLNAAIDTILKDKLSAHKAETDARIDELNKKVQNLQESLDRRIAEDLEKNQKADTVNTRIEKVEASCAELKKINIDTTKNSSTVDNRLEKVETSCADLRKANDGVEQQGRKETVEFHNIPFRYDVDGTEDTSDMCVQICNSYLDMDISTQDISVSHRQEHPDEKLRLGDDYIAPIYCKFVRRTLATTCVERQHMFDSRDLTNLQNNQKIFVRENLTLNRRNLWNRVKSELTSYANKWVKNGKIFVQKRNNTRSIRVMTEKVLNDILDNSPNGNRRRGTQPSGNEPIVHQHVRQGERRTRWPKKNLTQMPSNFSATQMRPAPVFRQPYVSNYSRTYGFPPPPHFRSQFPQQPSYSNVVQGYFQPQSY